MLENVIRAVMSPKEDEFMSPKEDEFKLEELRLEEEHRMLSSVNLALQEQLEAKEMERLKEEEHITEQIDSSSLGYSRQKPKSIFNFDNFKKKEMKISQKDEIEELNPRVQSMPKQKSKSGFSFFSSKERRKVQEPQLHNIVSSSNNSSSEDDSNKNISKNMISTSVQNESLKPQPLASPDTDQGVLDKSRFLAQSIVSELKRSTVNLSSNLDHTPEPTETMSPLVPASNGEKLSKGEHLPQQESQDTFNAFQKRSDSKSRFSMRKPKKKEKVEPQRNAHDVFVDDNTDLALAAEGLHESQSRSSTPSQSRPESRGRREKPAGIAEMFGFRSSKRGKSAERPKSSIFSGSKSPGVTQKNRPKSSDMTQPQQKPSLTPQQKEKTNLSNYFSNEMSQPSHNIQGNMKHSQSDFVLRNEQYKDTQPASLDVNYSQIQHRPQIRAQRQNLGRPPQPPNLNTNPIEPHSHNKEATPNRVDPVQIDRPNEENSPQTVDPQRSEPAENPSLAARRQTGRQSGRFRKSSSGLNNSSSHETSMNTSMISQGSNDAQSRFMESLVAAPELRSNPGRSKAATVGRAEGARIMRGDEQRAAPPGSVLSPARSEESIRDMGRPRAGSRAKGKKAGECSLM